MPRLLAFFISLGLFLTLTPNVYAEGSGIYVGGIAGASLRPDTTLSSPSLGSQPMDFDVGYTFGGFVGYDFGNNLRLETEISYRENEIRTGGGADPQAGTSSIMLNGFYDGIPFLKSFEVYLGGGLGWPRHNWRQFSRARRLTSMNPCSLINWKPASTGTTIQRPHSAWDTDSSTPPIRNLYCPQDNGPRWI